eukprot:TRINITY_DN9122_c0_g1_i1.p1 TRINITY_DN9122_c0_g1~~TRINITY_DN9122_c0_g1_i1.p1  ORF type:complete len:523 (+),score=90.53 TRINITY_DN9122_c0_g1_i1:51-1619(+)
MAKAPDLCCGVALQEGLPVEEMVASASRNQFLNNSRSHAKGGRRSASQVSTAASGLLEEVQCLRAGQNRLEASFANFAEEQTLMFRTLRQQLGERRIEDPSIAIDGASEQTCAQLKAVGGLRDDFEDKLQELKPRWSKQSEKSEELRQALVDISDPALKERIQMAATQAKEKKQKASRPSIRQWSQRTPADWQATVCEVMDFVGVAVVLANAAMIGVEVELLALGRDDDETFTTTLVIFTAWYTFELLFNALINLEKFCREWRWNAFDSAMLFLAYMELALPGNQGSEGGVSRMVRVLRIGRMGRIIRLGKSLSHIHEFCKLVLSVFHAGYTLLLAVLVMCFMMYIIAIIITQGVTDMPNPEANLTKHFGTLARSFYTLFASVTGGISWGDLMEPLLSMDALYPFLYSAYVTVIFLGVLNVLTSVFVESAMEATAAYRWLLVEQHKHEVGLQAAQLKEIFQQIDLDDSGGITEVMAMWKPYDTCRFGSITQVLHHRHQKQCRVASSSQLQPRSQRVLRCYWN